MNKLILEGKEYNLSDELIEKIKVEVEEQEKKISPFTRNTDESYFCISYDGTVHMMTDLKLSADDRIFSVGNYCRNKELIEQRALHETLNRLLWRYSETHGGDPAWTTEFVRHYEICYDYNCKVFRTVSVVNGKSGGIYFKDKNTAEAAIEEVVMPFIAKHPEFKW